MVWGNKRRSNWFLLSPHLLIELFCTVVVNMHNSLKTKAIEQVHLTTSFQKCLIMVIGCSEIAFWQQKRVFKLVCMPNLRPMTFATETHGQFKTQLIRSTHFRSYFIAHCCATSAYAMCGMLQAHWIEFWFLAGDNFRMNHVMQF